jgi:hypothetical protein
VLFFHKTFPSFFVLRSKVNNLSQSLLPSLGCWFQEHHLSNSRAPGTFGDYQCDSPWLLLESASKAMKDKQGDNVEFVLWTG